MSGRAPLIALGAVCLLSFFWSLGGNGLFDLDEGLYAECAREMAMTGDFVVPRVNGEPFFEKPPLVYWTAAAFYRLFGRSEITTRLPSALATVAVVALVWWFGRRRFGETAGTLAAFFFALSPLVFGSARQLTTDAVLNLCIAASLLAWFHTRISPSAKGRRFSLVFWIGMAFGVLAKGLPGLLIPLATVAVFVIFRIRRMDGEQLAPAEPGPRSASSNLLSLTAGLLLFAAIAVPWHVLAYRASGDAFTSEYIVRQHLARFRGGDTSHLAPLWFFVPGFLAGAFPWSFFVPAAFLSRCESEGDILRANTRRFLKIWAALVFLMFSASGSKLISYILPMYAPAALLAGDWCARAIGRTEARRSLLVAGVSSLIFAALMLGVIQFSEPITRAIEDTTNRPVRLDQLPPGSLRWAGHLFLAATVATGSFVLLTAANRRRIAFSALCAGMALFYAVAIFEGLPLIDRALLRPLHEMCRNAVFHVRGRDIALPLVLKTASERRPSALFYVPDRMIGRPFASGGVAETTDSRKALDLLHQVDLATALVDSASAREVIEQTGAITVVRNGSWLVLLYSRRK